MEEIDGEDFCNFLQEKINPYIEVKRSESTPQNERLPKEKMVFSGKGPDSAAEFHRQLGSNFRMAALYTLSLEHLRPSGKQNTQLTHNIDFIKFMVDQEAERIRNVLQGRDVNKKICILLMSRMQSESFARDDIDDDMDIGCRSLCGMNIFKTKRVGGKLYYVWPSRLTQEGATLYLAREAKLTGLEKKV